MGLKLTFVAFISCFVAGAHMAAAAQAMPSSRKCTSANLCCVPPSSPTDMSINLGAYKGYFQLDGAQSRRTDCPAKGPCICKLVLDKQTYGTFGLQFSGFYNQTHKVTIQNDNISVSPDTDLKDAIWVKNGKQIVLDPDAFRIVRVVTDGPHDRWNLENWKRGVLAQRKGEQDIILIRSVQQAVTVDELPVHDFRKGWLLGLDKNGQIDPVPCNMQLVAGHPMTLKLVVWNTKCHKNKAD